MEGHIPLAVSVKGGRVGGDTLHQLGDEIRCGDLMGAQRSDGGWSRTS